MNYPKSPLRYPGGKSRAIETILNFIPKNTEKVISPFIGGGSVEIAIASLGIQVYGYDIFEPLVDFWQELLLDAPRLASQVKKYFPLSKKKFYELQKFSGSTSLERASIFYVLNRCSFSGSTLCGGMSLGHPRFTRGFIFSLGQFQSPNLHVKLSDFHSIVSQADSLMYLDPPYLIKQILYGEDGTIGKDFDHDGLCEILKEKRKWILSYNDCPEIRRMYSDFYFLIPHWKYGMASDKNSNEVIILSPDLSKGIE